MLEYLPAEQDGRAGRSAPSWPKCDASSSLIPGSPRSAASSVTRAGIHAHSRALFAREGVEIWLTPEPAGGLSGGISEVLSLQSPVIRNCHDSGLRCGQGQWQVVALNTAVGARCVVHLLV